MTKWENIIYFQNLHPWQSIKQKILVDFPRHYGLMVIYFLIYEHSLTPWLTSQPQKAPQWHASQTLGIMEVRCVWDSIKSLVPVWPLPWSETLGKVIDLLVSRTDLPYFKPRKLLLSTTPKWPGFSLWETIKSWENPLYPGMFIFRETPLALPLIFIWPLLQGQWNI